MEIKKSIAKHQYHLLIFIGCMLYIGHWTVGQGWGDDFASYISQAMSIVDGKTKEFFVDNAFTINTSSYPLGPVAYPWGYPLLLSPVYYLFGFNLIGFKSVGLMCFFLYLVTLWKGFKKDLQDSELFVFVALFALNSVFLHFGDNILSDIPFLFLSTLGMVILNKIFNGEKIYGVFPDGLLIGIIAAACFAIRTNGALVIMVIAISLFIQGVRELLVLKKNKLLGMNAQSFLPGCISLTVGLITALGTSAAILSVFRDGQHSHFDQISWRVIGQNLIYYMVIPREFFRTFESLSIIQNIFYFISIPFFLFGCAGHFAKYSSFLIYSALTLILYLVWPWIQGLRFLFPILPFYIFFVLLGVRDLGNFWKNPKAPLRILVSLLILLMVTKSLNNVFDNLRNRGEKAGPFDRYSNEMFDFIRHNTRRNDVVVFRKPRVMRMLTGRQCVFYNKIDHFKNYNWIVLDKTTDDNQMSPADYAALLKDHPAKIVFSNRVFDIYSFYNAPLR